MANAGHISAGFSVSKRTSVTPTVNTGYLSAGLSPPYYDDAAPATGQPTWKRWGGVQVSGHRPRTRISMY
jgi:hypothetical protein